MENTCQTKIYILRYHTTGISTSVPQSVCLQQAAQASKLSFNSQQTPEALRTASAQWPHYCGTFSIQIQIKIISSGEHQNHSCVRSMPEEFPLGSPYQLCYRGKRTSQVWNKRLVPSELQSRNKTIYQKHTHAGLAVPKDLQTNACRAHMDFAI